jgi:hypothetical protein
MKDDPRMIIKNIEIDDEYMSMVAWLTLKMDFKERIDNIIFLSDVIESCKGNIMYNYREMITKEFAIYAYKDSVKNGYKDIFIDSYFDEDFFIVSDPVRFMYVYYMYKRSLDNNTVQNEY